MEVVDPKAFADEHNSKLPEQVAMQLRHAYRDAMLNEICRKVAAASLLEARQVQAEVRLPK